MEAKPSGLKGWLLFGAFGVIVFVVVSWLDDPYEIEPYNDDEYADELWPEDEYISPESLPPSPPIRSTLELARERYEWCQDQDQYCSEFTVIETYEKAVIEEADVFDEASEVYSALLESGVRSAVYLRVMRAYANLIPVHHAAIDNYLNTFDLWLSSESQVDRGTWDAEDAFWVFKQAWENSGGDERLAHKALEFETYFELAIREEDKFDVSQRYTEDHVLQLAYAGGQDPFRCSPLAERLNHLLWLSEVLGNEAKERKWKLHVADYFSTTHICEDGYPRPEPEQAFAMYAELGMDEDAKNAAWQVVSNAANSFVFGGDPYAPWLDYPEPCDPDQLVRLLLWYPRTGLGAQEQTQELYTFAQMNEEVGYLDAALKIYEALDAHEEVARLRPLAEKQPRPEEHVQLEHFFMRLEAAEANKHLTP